MNRVLLLVVFFSCLCTFLVDAHRSRSRQRSQRFRQSKYFKHFFVNTNNVNDVRCECVIRYTQPLRSCCAIQNVLSSELIPSVENGCTVLGLKWEKGAVTWLASSPQMFSIHKTCLNSFYSGTYGDSQDEKL